MNSPGLSRRRIGLNTRLGLGVAAVVLAATFAIATVALHLVKASMRSSIESEQLANVAFIADAIDQKLASRRTLLATFAASAEARDLDDEASLQSFLERHPSLHEAFDNVSFIDLQGELVANLNGAQQIGRLNVKDRPYFSDTVASGAGTISAPYRNRLNGLAQVAITQPVKDRTGQVRYVLSGLINLKERSFLGELAQVRFGVTGYVFIVSRDGVVVDHPDEARILQRMSTNGSGDAEIARAIAGFEGAAEGSDAAGVPGLYAFRQLRQTSWVLGSVYPRQEAFARLESIERTAWFGALALALAAGAVASVVVRRQLKPLTALHRRMLDAQAASASTPMAVPASYPADEIGDLGRTFDQLMRQQQIDEKFLRDITDNIPVMVSHADAQGRYTFVNARLAERLGRSAATLIGEPAQGQPGSGNYFIPERYLQRVAAGEHVTFERRDAVRQGEQARFFQTDLIPDRDGTGAVRGYYAMTSDVTERKRIELSLAHSEAQIRVIADNIPALVSHVDSSLRYTFVNAKVRALHNGDVLLGKAMSEIAGTSDFAEVEPFYRRAMAGETVIVEQRGDPALGVGDRTYKAHYIPDPDDVGMVQGVFAMTFDITDEVQVRNALAEQEKRLRDVTDNIPAVVGYFDREERCHFANSRGRRMAGLGDEPLEGVTLRAAMGEAVYAQQKPHLAAVLAGEPARFQVEAPLHGKTGYFQTNMIPDLDLQGQVHGFYLMAFNVTALKETELQLAESEMRLRAITDNIPALITYIDSDEIITFANGTYREWLGLDPNLLLGKHIREVAGEELYLARKELVDRALAGERVEFEAQTRKGEFDRVTRVIYVPHIEADGATHGIFSLSFDVTALKAVERKLIELARVDTLTGLPNRLAFNEQLPAAITHAAYAGRGIALMFLDVDHFKSINDTLGHASGDAVLIEYARRLRDSVRSTDTVARLAGDEFVVVLEDIDAQEAAAVVARKILRKIGGSPFRADGRDLDITTSIGVVYVRDVDATMAPGDLLARADVALYSAKAAGRNTFAFVP
ncbi:PAS domain-containing protein [Variovorax sp. KK3]|uniref:sensor domain-containing diguanylate cyclase n=1 Tax=Variovorax sp. KK3 TaxID=1855728 RepID=UPI00097BD5F1|nr:PAS domain-containing protein [Variovorax sp. KK3]